MKAVLLLLLWFTPAYAILPLPYPAEPWEEEDFFFSNPVRDPRSIKGLSELYSGGQLREMELPNFANRSSLAGYHRKRTFRVPKSLKPRVDFWKKIYTEYTTNQVVLHDSRNLGIVYGVTDIGHIKRNKRLSKRRQRRHINRFLKKEKKKVVRILMMLDKLRDRPLEIPLSMVPIFKQFEGMKNKDKFLRAVPYIRTQVGQRDAIVEGFLYGGRYFNKMMEIFEQYKIPKELTRLTLVESAFNLRARSKVGASGVWQFLRSTGKRYLRIDRAVDERNDPILATVAAAKLLRKNFEKLGTWPLAITAYNHGRAGMAKAVRLLSTRNLATIIKHYKSRTFGFASSNFYPSFLAILEIERDYRKYFGKIMVDSPEKMQRIRIAKPLKFSELALACALDEEELSLYNPSLTRWVTAGMGRVPKDYVLQIPTERYERCVSGFQNISE